MEKEKTDKLLGAAVRAMLIKKGIETPLYINNPFSREEKLEKIEHDFRGIMITLGLDINDDSLIDTPKRVAKMYVDEFFSGLNYDNFPKCTAVLNKMKADQAVIERNITVQSNCEHHFVIIDGVCTVAYIPRDKILGLSKLNRVVEFFARRPQIQERLVEQIFQTLCFILETDDVAVHMNCIHYCVKARGVKHQNSSTITNKVGGAFLNEASCRDEFMKSIDIR